MDLQCTLQMQLLHFYVADKSDQKIIVDKKNNFYYSYIFTEYLDLLVAMVTGIDAMILSIHYFECYCSSEGLSSSLLRISCSPDGRLKHGAVTPFCNKDV